MLPGASGVVGPCQRKGLRGSAMVPATAPLSKRRSRRTGPRSVGRLLRCAQVGTGRILARGRSGGADLADLLEKLAREESTREP